MKSIDYLNLIFESQQNIDVALLHTIPAPLFPCANLHV
ncbi:Uncharacterized protein dnl_48490 [Desulfonema limicola]|uniref:Uncharacterized protein n=1 Tax=Desulfonema limicola TaxID=45656 RepID=A0A975BB93_9BACT|nr:Uncharacterized protein dnl_48490 [Desulfonema limicola]